jgi:hypothetical protein
MSIIKLVVFQALVLTILYNRGVDQQTLALIAALSAGWDAVEVVKIWVGDQRRQGYIP